MGKIMKKILLSICLFCSFCIGANIKNIDFKGLSYLSKESAMEFSGLKINENFDEEKLNQAVLKLYELNYFSSILVEEKNGNILFTLKEKPSIAKITVNGIASNDKQQIDMILELKKGHLYDESSAKDAAQKIKMYYEARGYFDTIVDFEVKNLLNTKGLELVFNANRGENIIIKNIILSGSQELSYKDIEPSITNKKREFMGWMWGRNDGKLRIFDLGNDTGRINEVYLKNGFLDAKISTPFLKTHTDTYEADLSYFIEEGQSYKIKDIQIINPIFDDNFNQKQIKNLKSKINKTFDISKVRHDANLIQTNVANQGYFFAQVYPDIQKDTQNKEVNLIFKVEPGEKVFIRNITISGNTRTIDEIIRREIYLSEGYLYHKDDLIESINALRRTSYFENVEIKEEIVDNNHIDLLIEVKEASTGAISGSIGYGSSDGFLINASISDSNIFGSGLRGSLNLDSSSGYNYLNSTDKSKSISGRLSLINPRIYDSHYSLGGTIYSHDYEWTSYYEKNYGFDITLGRSFWRYFNASLTYNLENSNIYHLSYGLINSGYEIGKSLKSSIIPAISFNNTDDYYLPRSGIIFNTSLEYAGLGGDQRFLSTRTSFNFYQGLEEWLGIDLIYRYKANFYRVWDRGKLPVNQRFFLGGVRSIRGFESRTVSPKNIITNIIANEEQRPESFTTGGDIAFNNSVELSFPLIDRIKLRAALFFDFGIIKNDTFKKPYLIEGGGYGILNEGFTKFDVKNNPINQEIRYSAGVSLEWITPIGPLQLIFAKPLNKKPGDDTNSFEFMLGTRF